MDPKRLIALTVAAAALSAAPLASAQEPAGLERAAARVAQAGAGRPLAVGATPAASVNAYLRARGRSAAVLSSLRTEQSRNARGITHLQLRQEIDGLAVHGAYLKAAVNSRGELVHVVETLVDVSAPAPARIDAATAVRSALAQLHPGQGGTLRLMGTAGATTRFDAGAFFHSPPSATAVLAPLANGGLARAWLVETWTLRTNELNHTLVGGDGRVLEVERRTANDSYRVYPIDPGKSGSSIVSGPGATTQSPAGWLGSGSQSTVRISGNNVAAYLDTDTDNTADAGGSDVFDGNFLTAADLTAEPVTTTNQAAGVQNLFYLNNRIHDILYGYGFDEAAGNFQVDNFGRGGQAGDAVQAEGQDGGGTDNANFSTPTDGNRPRMQMYLWTGAGATHEVLVSAPVNTTYGAMGAGFGAELGTAGLSGDILAAVPADACSRVTTALAGRIALVERGSCDFSTKVLNAQRAGAAAVIVANNAATDIFTMGPGQGANRVSIPSVMISQADGTALKALVAPSGTTRKLAVQPLQIDAMLDSDVVYHEYCHGLTWRMIGSMSGPLAGAIGEGMSDACALLINGDDVVGEYGGSSAGGIRRYPYAGYPLKYTDVTGAEVHNDGEIYAAIVWRMKELFDAAYGGATGTSLLFGYVVDGMNYTASSPAFEDMRDGILASITNSGGTAADTCRVWTAFAQYEVGVGAKGSARGQTRAVVTGSTAKPASCP